MMVKTYDATWSQGYDDELKISVCLLECITLEYIENVGSTTNIILITSALSTTLIRILLMGL